MKNDLSHASDVSRAIKKANDITIVGDGPVGIEPSISGEIGYKYSNKNILD